MSRRPIRIEVTQAHVDRGQRKKSAHCPVALAVQEVFGDYNLRGDYITASSWFINSPFGLIETPATVKEFIHRFDRGDPVEPFTFEL